MKRREFAYPLAAALEARALQPNKTARVAIQAVPWRRIFR